MTAHTRPIKCGHCNTNSVMNLIGDITHVTDIWESEDPYPSSLEFGYTYHLLECLTCKKPTIARYGWNSDAEDDEEFWGLLRYADFLYPPNSMYSVDVVQNDPAPWFIDPTRIQELLDTQSGQFDLSKLIQICKEINICHANNCLLSVATLCRALLDHIPPIFECRSFTEIANNYKGTKSFKDSADYLDKSLRKIADAFLHVQIRSQETLPNKTQINFHNGLDVLLSEVVRVLQHPIPNNRASNVS